MSPPEPCAQARGVAAAKGERNITLLTILELAEALEVKPGKLLDFE